VIINYAPTKIQSSSFISFFKTLHHL